MATTRYLIHRVMPPFLKKHPGDMAFFLGRLYSKDHSPQTIIVIKSFELYGTDQTGDLTVELGLIQRSFFDTVPVTGIWPTSSLDLQSGLIAQKMAACFILFAFSDIPDRATIGEFNGETLLGEFSDINIELKPTELFFVRAPYFDRDRVEISVRYDYIE